MVISQGNRHACRGGDSVATLGAGFRMGLTPVCVHKLPYEHAGVSQAGLNLKWTPPRALAFTVRVSRKAEIRTALEQSFGYSHAWLFPDMAVFHDQGRQSFR